MLSPKTQETIDQLLGRAALSVDELSIGPLDSTGLLVLRILVENSDHFASTVGEERAKSFASLVKQEAAAPSGDDSSPENLESTTETTAVTAPVRGWRLSKTTATNYRGLAPWNQTIDFEFSEETILIYGPNGSGKSSLLGAVVWTLTGQAPVDSDTQEDKFKVHRPTEETSLGPSIGEWPRHCTLPPADISSEQPTCTVTVQLSRGAEDDYLFIRRSDVDGLQVSRDGASWEITEDLTGYGITPLDLQLSLAAPSMFGRRTLDQAQDTSDVLRLLLGLDDLAALGKLAGDISGNCTRRKNKLISEANGITGDIRQAAVRLEEGMPEGSAEKGVFGQLLATEILVDDVKSCGEALNGLLANILTEIASAVGFGAEHDEEPPTGLADALTTALNHLESGPANVFKNFHELKQVADATDGQRGDLNAVVDQLTEKADEFAESAKKRLAARLDWWNRENEEDAERLNLKLRAAQLYVPEKEACPVCEFDISGKPIAGELAELRPLSDALAEKVDRFVGILQSELSSSIPDAISGLATGSPGDRILADWDEIRAKLGDVFKNTANQFHGRINDLTARLPKLDTTPVDDLVPVDIDPTFLQHVQPLIDDLRIIRSGIEILRWWEANGEDAIEALCAIVTDEESSEAPTTLLSILSKGKGAVQRHTGLNRAVKELRELYRKANDAGAKRTEAEFIETLQSALAEIKKLEKYAEFEVSRVFADISGKTNELWTTMYSTNPSGLEPGGLIRRGKEVGATLKSDHFRVPTHFVGNAGLQRAVALAFYFALLEHHPRVLEFLVLDDVTTSLDELHREKWAAKILEPAMTDWQVICASHQRDFFDHHSHRFPEDWTFKLNRRTNQKPISILPGNDLARAEALVNSDWEAAGNVLRKFVDKALGTLDAYNAEESFYNAESSLPGCLRRLRDLTEASGIRQSVRAAICNIIEEPEVLPVVQYESHLYPSHSVTQSMVENSLMELRKVDEILRGEVRRIGRDRRPAREANANSQVFFAEFPQIPDAANWNESIGVACIGRAAASPEEIAIESSGEATQISIKPASAVLAVSNVLDPIARRGQWILIAPDEVQPIDGDLAAVSDGVGNMFLRRVWDVGDSWRLEGVNPISPRKAEELAKGDASVRKIIGIIFEPRQSTEMPEGETVKEWSTEELDIPSVLKTYRGITVENDSLEPIARSGQIVLVGDPQAPASLEMSQGSLGVVEVKESSGHVIKRVYSSEGQLSLVSPNPVQAYPPIQLAINLVDKVWPVRGLLFNFHTDD